MGCFLLYISHYSLCYSASPLLLRKKTMNMLTIVNISGSHRSGLLIVDIRSLSPLDGASTVTLPTPHARDPLSHLMAITGPLRAINTPKINQKYLLKNTATKKNLLLKMAHSVYRLFMDDLRHWNILDTIFYDFYLFSNGDVYPEIRFRVKGTIENSRFPGLATLQ